MLRTDVIDVINSGTAYAFIGSGPSTEAQLPTWGSLVENLCADQEKTNAHFLHTDARFRQGVKSRNYPLALERLATLHSSQEHFRSEVNRHISTDAKPGKLHRLLADTPFRGYITTNYDHLLEDALAGLGQQFVSVGNSDSECQKIGAQSERIVWHIHGSFTMGDAAAPVLTQSDYDNVYGDGVDGPTLSRLKALMSQNRIVFVGFGFNDPDVMRVLKSVGRLSSPSRPAYALLPHRGDVSSEATREELRDSYNIDSITYKVRNGDHSNAVRVFSSYAAFTPARSLTFDPTRRVPTEEHDSDCAGLLIYNHFSLGDTAKPIELDSRSLLLKSHIMAELAFGPRLVEEMEGGLRTKSKIYGEHGDGRASVSNALAALQQQGYVELSNDLAIQNSTASLTNAGRESAAGGLGRSDLLRDQFVGSLRTRVRDTLGMHADDDGAPEPDIDEEAEERILQTITAFFIFAANHKALALSLLLSSDNAIAGAKQQTSLLQSLPTYLEFLADSEEAITAVDAVRAVMISPTGAERRYLGILIQARFGVHLLGADEDSLRVRVEVVRRTVFVLDAPILIAMVAAGCKASERAHRLVRLTRDAGALLVSTPLLVEEVAEHARWALDHFLRGGSDAALASLLGRSGSRGNLFYEGYASQLAAGLTVPNFQTYLASLLPDASEPLLSVENGSVEGALERAGIVIRTLEEWEGVRESTVNDFHSRATEIGAIRKARGSFRHQRQVEAEAEAEALVREFRSESLGGAEVDDAYFVTNTHFIDRRDDPQRGITMSFEGALEWLISVRPLREGEVDCMTDFLLDELSNGQGTVLDYRVLRMAFGTSIDASRLRLNELMDRHRALIEGRYGVSALDSLKSVKDVHVPGVLRSLAVQLSESAEQAIKRAEASGRQSTLTANEREEFEALREMNRRRRANADERKRKGSRAEEKRRARKRRKRKRRKS